MKISDLYLYMDLFYSTCTSHLDKLDHCEDGHNDEPEPEEDENFLVEKVDRQNALDSPSVNTEEENETNKM